MNEPNRPVTSVPADDLKAIMRMIADDMHADATLAEWAAGQDACAPGKALYGACLAAQEGARVRREILNALSRLAGLRLHWADEYLASRTPSDEGKE